MFENNHQSLWNPGLRAENISFFQCFPQMYSLFLIICVLCSALIALHASWPAGCHCSLPVRTFHFKQQWGRCLTTNQHHHMITWILFLARRRKLSDVVPCTTSLCWSTCSVKCIWKTGYACTQCNEEIKGVWKQKQEAICHTIHPSMLCLPQLPHSFPWSILYHTETVSSANVCSPVKTWQSVSCIQFLYIP